MNFSMKINEMNDIRVDDLLNIEILNTLRNLHVPDSVHI